jgi:SAM-dependent methyltransferase
VRAAHETEIAQRAPEQARLRAALSIVRSHVDALTHDIRHLVPPAVSPTNVVAAAEGLQQLDDVRYLGFEDEHRGTADDVRSVLGGYLADFLERRDLGGRLIDVGCGRGEWLQLVTEQGIAAIGVDSNEASAAAARELGVDVVVADAFEYLASLDEGSCLGVTAFHVLEHLHPTDQHRFFELALRVLQPGGLVVSETPNPTNLVVGASAFYRDPTHVRPIHPDFLTFLAEHVGFVGVELRFLHPRPQYELIGPFADEMMEDVRWALYGPQDVAVVARRPARVS